MYEDDERTLEQVMSGLFSFFREGKVITVADVGHELVFQFLEMNSHLERIAIALENINENEALK